jgi:hypothetical protein
MSEPARRPADVCRVLGRCASRQLSPGPRCFLLRLFGVGQQRVDGAAAPLGGRCLAAPAGQVGRGHGRARADPSASPPAGDDACSFPSPRVGGGGRATGRAPMTGLLVSWRIRVCAATRHRQAPLLAGAQSGNGVKTYLVTGVCAALARQDQLPGCPVSALQGKTWCEDELLAMAAECASAAPHAG